MRLIPFSRKSELAPVTSLFDDFVNSFFDDKFSRDSQLMALDVIEHEKTYELRANFPGYERKDINIAVNGDNLVIEAAHTEEKEKQEEGVYHIRERYSGHYRRSVRLPENCDPEQIKAKLEDGVLKVHIPKIEPKPKKEITIE